MAVEAVEAVLSGGAAHVLGAIMSTLVIVLVLVNCVCAHSNKQASQENGDISSSKREKPKRSSKKSKKENGAVATADIELQDVSRRRNSSNLSNGSSHRDSGDPRPKSQHDGSRALPEIPNGEASYSSADKNFHPYATVQGEQDSQTYAAVSGQNSEYDPDYAGIGTDTTADTASETYAAVRDTQQPAQSNAKRVVKNSHPYAEVKIIGDATYAQISEKPSSSSGKRKAITSTISTDTVDSATIPPIPEKHPELLETGSGSNRSSSTIQAGSPSLPPRNSVLDSASIPYADEGSPQHTLYSPPSSPSPKQGQKREPPYDDITARESLSHIRERQALEHASHVTPGTSGYDAGGGQYDREYDEIQAVPAAQGGAGREARVAAAGDRNSLASDTYAEIWQNDQAIGLRTSMYAQVDEMENSHAPTPPPIDTLKQLSHDGGIARQRPMSAYSTGSSTYHTVGDIDITTQQNSNTKQSNQSQPIYAVPNKQRDKKKRQTVHGDMQSVNNSNTSAKKTLIPVEHLYSQVDKTKRAEKKSKRNERNEGSYDNIVQTESFRNKGARPKLKTQQDVNRNVDSSSISGAASGSACRSGATFVVLDDRGRAPGYQTIGDVRGGGMEHRQGDAVAQDDPDYDTVQEGAVVVMDAAMDADMDQYDVDYESLPGSAAAIATRAPASTSTYPTSPLVGYGNLGDSNANHVHSVVNMPITTDTNENNTTGSGSTRSASTPVQPEQAESGADSGASLIHVSQHRPRSQPYTHREHIYEVISDRSHENIYTADPTRHITSRKVHMPRAPGQGNQSPPQFITNL